MDKYNSRMNVFIKVTKNYFMLVKHTTIKNQAYRQILSVLSTVVSSNDKEKSNDLFFLFSI